MFLYIFGIIFSWIVFVRVRRILLRQHIKKLDEFYLRQPKLQFDTRISVDNEEDSMYHLKQWAKENPEIDAIYYRNPAIGPTVKIVNPELIKEFVRLENKAYKKLGFPSMNPSSTLLVAKDNVWKNHRRAIAKAL